MAIDMPPSPSNGDIYLATNGINYQWDGTKWEVYVDPSLGANVWGRDSNTSSIFPANDGDNVLLKNNSGTTKITMTGNGDITAIGFRIDSLTSLP